MLRHAGEMLQHRERVFRHAAAGLSDPQAERDDRELRLSDRRSKHRGRGMTLRGRWLKRHERELKRSPRRLKLRGRGKKLSGPARSLNSTRRWRDVCGLCRPCARIVRYRASPGPGVRSCPLPGPPPGAALRGRGFRNPLICCVLTPSTHRAADRVDGLAGVGRRLPGVGRHPGYP